MPPAVRGRGPGWRRRQVPGRSSLQPRCKIVRLPRCLDAPVSWVEGTAGHHQVTRYRRRAVHSITCKKKNSVPPRDMGKMPSKTSANAPVKTSEFPSGSRVRGRGVRKLRVCGVTKRRLTWAKVWGGVLLLNPRAFETQSLPYTSHDLRYNTVQGSRARGRIHGNCVAEPLSK